MSTNSIPSPGHPPDNNPLSNVDIYGLLAVVVNDLEVGSYDDTEPMNQMNMGKSESWSFTAKSEEAAAQVQFTCASIDCTAPGTDAMLGAMGLLYSPPATQTAGNQQKAQTAQSQQQAQEQKPTQSEAPPVGPDGKPQPPPVPVPGAPDLEWKWSPDSGNPRGGNWTPKGWEGPNPPAGSWDPGKKGKPGHWDVDNGKGQRQRYDKFGKPITPEEAHASASIASRASNFVHAHPIATGVAAGVVIIGAAAAIVFTGGAAAPPLAAAAAAL